MGTQIISLMLHKNIKVCFFLQLNFVTSCLAELKPVEPQHISTARAVIFVEYGTDSGLRVDKFFFQKDLNYYTENFN
jgi:hypothetical protein